MNHAQIILFFIYALAVFSAGVGVSTFLKVNDPLSRNRFIFFGESLLLGSILIVGELVALSLIGLYRGIFLWGIVCANFLFLFHPATRKDFQKTLSIRIAWNAPVVAFSALLVIFFFRNLYFLVDVDSHAVYLFAQKLWLEHGTSIFADRGMDARIFVPHFDCVPYSLGLSLFGQETLFPQLVNWFWRFIAVLLVFGYTSERFNGYYGLAAVMLVLFNQHIFFSGANQWVLINGALIAFLFASLYNLWEARTQKSPCRFLLALIFLSQLLANKYQMAYVLVALSIVGLMIQPDPYGLLREIWTNRRFRFSLIIAGTLTSLWYFKNLLATGLPTFPVLAGHFHVLGWTPDRQEAFMQVFRGLSINEFLKFASYFFVWPGIIASKYVGLTITFLPFIYLFSSQRGRFDPEKFLELCYWLGVSFFILFAECLASHQDPRYYRYIIGIYAFTAVFALDYILRNVLNIRQEVVTIAIILLLCLPGYKILKQGGGGSFLLPSWQDNMNVLLNRLHMKDVIAKHYPQNTLAREGYEQNLDKAREAAWFTAIDPRAPSVFLLPERPQIDLWNSTIINWASYDSEEKIAQDIRGYGLKWVMRIKNDQLEFLSPEEFAQEAVHFDRRPRSIFYAYDFPEELTLTKFK